MLHANGLRLLEGIGRAWMCAVDFMHIDACCHSLGKLHRRTLGRVTVPIDHRQRDLTPLVVASRGHVQQLERTQISDAQRPPGGRRLASTSGASA